ncbi:hypothetical protein CKO28_06015 [Rhodovibrio sodomensis]|uniref:Uncharacterized protein n=1 Tax=Rhodovibrio sodomensis TaxID=1088 RepID=A0ABS1DAW5_9PROT|nr:hypothetical protein [Rhodovibrio sodomensis]MBK1667587.1 hypothetical protein [Rhodovibrio sodomensis]
MKTTHLPGSGDSSAFDAYRVWHGAIWGAFFGRLGWSYTHFGGDLAPDAPALWVGKPLPATAVYAIPDHKLMDLHPDSTEARDRWGRLYRDITADGTLLLPDRPQTGNLRLPARFNAANAAVLGWYLPPLPEEIDAGDKADPRDWCLMLLRRPEYHGAADPAPVSADSPYDSNDPELLDSVINDRMPAIGWIDAEFDAREAGYLPVPMPGLPALPRVRSTR